MNFIPISNIRLAILYLYGDFGYHLIALLSTNIFKLKDEDNEEY